MTWYAHHVFATPTAQVRTALAAAWPGHVYWVRDLAGHARREREVYAMTITPDGGGDPEYRDVEVGPGYPDGGLVVVRELCHPSSHAAEWFGEAAVSWGADADGDDDDDERDPPAELVERLRGLAHDTGTVVSLFLAATWGGDLEYARSVVFDGAWGVEHTYVHEYDEARPMRPRVRATCSIAPDRAREIVDGDVLTLTLVHHGLLLERGHFELHTRSFPWEDHRDQ